MSGNIMLPVLDDRLLLIASMVREGGIPLDVGTDHAYVPIYLIKSGICKRAVASDINRGPLRRACENARKFNVYDKIDFCLADGIKGTQPEKYGVTDIIIAGMGGEMIAQIIDNSDYTRIPDIRLILQPMSTVQELRGYLAEMGYATLNERVCCAGNKYYTCISAEYDGIRREVPPVRLEIGYGDQNDGDPAVNGFLQDTADKLKRRILGKRKGGISCEHEESTLKEVCEIAAARGYKIKL